MRGGGGQCWSGLIGDDGCWLLGGVAERLGGGRWVVVVVGGGRVVGLLQGGSWRFLEVWRGHVVLVVVGTWSRGQWGSWGVELVSWAGAVGAKKGAVW